MRRTEPASLGEVFTRSQALMAGLTRHEVEWALASRHWLTLRRATYCRRETYDAADPQARHLLHCRAALLAHDDRHVLSHHSAALTFGLPLPLGPIGRPTLTIGETAASTDRQEDLVVQVATLRPEDVQAWEGFRRTSVTRTVADCLRHLDGPDAVAIADAALRSGRTSVTALAKTLARQGGWPYAARGWAALGLVDGRRESWLESYSFVVLHGEGIPLPTPQVEILGPRGERIARVDGMWPKHATVAEADGRAKYALTDWADLEASTAADLVEARFEAARRSLVREKLREDRLRSVGLEIVRWGTHDIVHRRPDVVANIRAAWRRGDPGRFEGTAVVPAAADLSWPSAPGSP